MLECVAIHIIKAVIAFILSSAVCIAIVELFGL